MSLDSQATEQIKHAIEHGYAVTPTSSDRPSDEDRQKHIDIIVRCVFSEYNMFHRAVHIQRIVKIVYRTIYNMKARGLWNQTIPSRRTLERSVNYAASVTWKYNEGHPRVIALKPGLYFVNPILFDTITLSRLQQIILEAKARPTESYLRFINDPEPELLE
ncbi:MAG: hypothetical protein KGN01_07490 [Patescibacteria group bacterium]|nr:hypothetical protein [Patescibacteria group bacterium]